MARNSAIITTSICLIIGALLILWAVNLKIPDFSGFEERKVAQSTKIYDRTGEVMLFNVQENIHRTIVPASEISHHIKNATVAIEDKIFYEHKGIRFSSIVRAFLANLRSGEKVQGASTITQQVIKNALLTKEKQISRKIKEIILALKLEREMSKDQILTLYLNESPYGGTMYGVEEASQSFFGKPASEVGLAEAAYLAALPQAPTFYSPYGNNLDELEKRKNLVLSRMAELGFVTEEEALAAKTEVVSFLPQDDISIKAPHFVFYVKEQLETNYGREMVENGGLTVITSLDWELQQKAEEIIKSRSEELEENFDAKNQGVIGLDPSTGEILVMVGSRDYFEEENDGAFNVTTSPRQPGSSFKPFVYATAFKKGYRPDTVVFDLPTQFETRCSPDDKPLTPGIECYRPVNYDNTYKGPISLRDALAQSVNIPAIKTLYLAGLRESLQTARDFGITSLVNVDRYGLTLVLGGGEVSLLELTNAYSVFATGGMYTSETAILKVSDSDGDVLEEYRAISRRVINEDVALQITDVLSDNSARAPAFGFNSPLYFAGRDVAAKTGTTNDYRDMWVVGYTPNFVLGLWVGNNDNSSMEKKVAGFVAAPLWNAILSEALESRPSESFKHPRPLTQTGVKPIIRGLWQGSETYDIDTVSGKLATEYTPKETREERVIPDLHSILHWVSKRDPLGPIPINPTMDAQYLHWELPVIKWAAENGYYIDGKPNVPTETDDVHGPDSAPVVQVVSPLSSNTYNSGERLPISYMVTKSKYQVTHADFFVNGDFVGSTLFPLNTFTIVPSQLDALSGTNTVRVDVYDNVKNKTSVTTTFNVGI